MFQKLLAICNRRLKKKGGGNTSRIFALSLPPCLIGIAPMRLASGQFRALIRITAIRLRALLNLRRKVSVQKVLLHFNRTMSHSLSGIVRYLFPLSAEMLSIWGITIKLNTNVVRLTTETRLLIRGHRRHRRHLHLRRHLRHRLNVLRDLNLILRRFSVSLKYRLLRLRHHLR